MYIQILIMAKEVIIGAGPNLGGPGGPDYI